jgi:CRISPR system Cascade subunit CasC
MSYKIMFHSLRFYAQPVNRDKHGNPKSLEIAGIRRNVNSSQAVKNWIRIGLRTLEDMGIVVSIQTRSIGLKIKKMLLDGGKTEAEADQGAADLLQVYIPHKEVAEKPEKAEKVEKPVKDGKKPKKEPKEKNALITETVRIFPEEMKLIEAQIKDYLEGRLKSLKDAKLVLGGVAVDIALSGTMRPSNIRGACKVGFDIGTTPMATEEDWFTAQEELQEFATTEGASHMGSKKMGSFIAYGYQVIDFDLLVENLKGNVDLAKLVVGKMVDLIDTFGPNSESTSAGHADSHCTYMMIEKTEWAPRSFAVASEIPVDKTEENVARIRNCQKYYCAANPSVKIQMKDCWWPADGRPNQGSFEELKQFAMDIPVKSEA